MLIVTAYFFIFVISMINSSAITDIAAKIGIDTRGRLYYYNAVMSLGEFSPLYFGIGRNMVSAHLTDEFSYLRISAPHSDILKIYIEGGFIVFGWWLWYTLVHITKKLKQKYSISVSNVYFILGMYTFILNLTDNVDTYFVCRILPIQIVMVVALFGSDRLIWKRLLGK